MKLGEGGMTHVSAAALATESLDRVICGASGSEAEALLLKGIGVVVISEPLPVAGLIVRP